MRLHFTAKIYLKCFLWAGFLLPLLSFSYALPAYASPDERTAFEQVDRGTVISYIRHKALALLPTKTVMGSLRDMGRQFQGVKQWFGFNGGPGAEESAPTDMETAINYVSGLMHPGDVLADREAFWLTPGYHHADGIMPWNDSVTLGFNYERAVLQDSLHLKVKPYVGQGWARSGSTWGTEASMTFGHQGDKHQPWAAINFSYDDGDRNLAGDERGFDVNGEWAIKPHLNLTIGARSREGEDHSGYALLRWRWTIDGSALDW